MQEKKLKIDPHTHSNGISLCSRLTVQEIIDEKKRRGYDGIVLTNHCQGHYYPEVEHAAYIERVIEEYRRAKAYGETQNFLVMLGLEVSIVDPSYNDWLLYGVTEEFLRASPCLYKMSQRGLFELCEKWGVVLVQAHPFRNSGWGEKEFMHGAEINCSKGDAYLANDVLALAEERGLLVTCGTDFHFTDNTYQGGMLVPADIKTSVDFANYLKTSACTEIFLEDRTVLAPTQKKLAKK